MNTKAKITLVSEQPLTLNSHWIEPVIAEHVSLQLYEPQREYDLKSTVFYAALKGSSSDVHKLFVDRGFKVAYDNLWEHPVPTGSKYIIQHWDWIRYYESLWYRHWNYHGYVPNKTYSNLALMPMRLKKYHRDLAVQKLDSLLDRFVWSYVSAGRQLPNDLQPDDLTFQRFFHPSWYDDTYFSVVCESTVALINNQVFISEKTYKPIAFYHPFLILGPMGTLQNLRRLGFETFDNIFDESYDLEPSWVKRLDCLVQNVTQFCQQPYDKITTEKMRHNHATFFDTNLAQRFIFDQIIEPLLNYAET